MDNPSTKGTIAAAGTAAGISGAGSGTLLIALVRNLSDSSAYKSWMTIIAPTVSVIVTAIVAWTGYQANEYFKRKRIRDAFEEAMKAAQDIIDSDTATKRAKDQARANQSRLRQLMLDHAERRFQTELQ
jgi:hypothetical protein